jgi:ribosome-interacting GTPase 1
MPRDPLIALVGKPSSGKSTTLNSLTDATSKVGAPSTFSYLLQSSISCAISVDRVAQATSRMPSLVHPVRRIPDVASDSLPSTPTEP